MSYECHVEELSKKLSKRLGQLKHISSYCHSTHAFCTNRIGLDPVHVCSSTWRPCFLKHRVNVQVHTISWCQKWDLFEQASSRSTRNSSSENKGTFHVSSSKNSKFNTRSSRSLSVQVSNFKLLHIQTRVLSHLK